MTKGFHSDDAPSAGTTSPSALCRQPNTTSGNIWPMMWRADTAQGGCALRMQSAGALMRTGANDPALLGTDDPMMQRTPKDA